jgi:hypothetical protein
LPDRETFAELTDSGPEGEVRGLRTAKTAAETLSRLLAAFEMFDLGVDMMTPTCDAARTSVA